MISNIWNRNGRNRDCPLRTTQVDQSRKNDKSGAVMKDVTHKEAQ